MFARIKIKFEAGDSDSYSGVKLTWGDKSRTWNSGDAARDFILARTHSQHFLEKNKVVTGLLLDSSVPEFCRTFTEYLFDNKTKTLKKK